MRRELSGRDRVNIKNRHTMPRRNLFEPATVLHDLLLVMRSHRAWYSRRTRDVGKIRYNDRGVRFLLEGAEYLFVIL